LKEAARRLQVCEVTVPHLIEERKLPATQVVAYAPWEIPVEARRRSRPPRSSPLASSAGLR
jgi:hypothetical protein